MLQEGKVLLQLIKTINYFTIFATQKSNLFKHEKIINCIIICIFNQYY